MKRMLMVVCALTCLCFTCGGNHPGDVRIMVIDANHQAVNGATVTLLDHMGHVISSGTSDTNGMYIYRQQNPVNEVLEVTADSPDDLQHDAGIINIQPGEMASITLMLNE